MAMKFVNIIFLILVLAALMHMCTRFAQSHEIYSGLKNPVTDEDCCGNSHCEPIAVERVVETHDEFIVDGKWHFVKNQALPSSDGQYHACIVGENLRCFLFPSNV